MPRKVKISKREAKEAIGKLRRTARYVRMEGIGGDVWADVVDLAADECVRIIRKAARRSKKK